MKKKLVALGIVIAMTLGFSTITYADNAVIKTDSEGKLSVSNISLDAFSEMAPGDTAMETIEIRNDSESVQNFYVLENTVVTLEETNNAAGGAYKFDMLVGETTKDATSLLSKEVGGYKSNKIANSNGLADVDEINDYTFMTQLEPGESTNLYMTLFLNGEGNDTAGYANAIGKLELSFKTVVPSHPVIPGEPSVVKSVIDIVTSNPVIQRVKTGDTTMIILPVIILLVGASLVIVGIKKRKKRKMTGTLAIIFCMFLSLVPTSVTKASDTVSLTLRAGEAGRFNTDKVNAVKISDVVSYEITEEYVRVTVPKKSVKTVNDAINQAFGIYSLDAFLGEVTDHEGYSLLSSGSFGSDLLNHNENYVLDYGVLVNPVMYTVEYVDVENTNTAVASPYINYGEAGDEITIESVLVSNYATSQKLITFTLDEASENIHQFYYAYTGYEFIPGEVSYETVYNYLTEDQIHIITVTADGNGTGGVANAQNVVNDNGADVNIEDEETPLSDGASIEDEESPLAAGNDEITDIDDENIPLSAENGTLKCQVVGIVVAIVVTVIATVTFAVKKKKREVEISGSDNENK